MPQKKKPHADASECEALKAIDLLAKQAEQGSAEATMALTRLGYLASHKLHQLWCNEKTRGQVEAASREVDFFPTLRGTHPKSQIPFDYMLQRLPIGQRYMKIGRGGKAYGQGLHDSPFQPIIQQFLKAVHEPHLTTFVNGKPPKNVPSLIPRNATAIAHCLVNHLRENGWEWMLTIKAKPGQPSQTGDILDAAVKEAVAKQQRGQKVGNEFGIAATVIAKLLRHRLRSDYSA